MPHTLFAQFLNLHFGAFTTSLLRSLHIQPAYPQTPITDAFAMEVLVFAVLLVYFVFVRVTLNVEKPNNFQHLAEMTHEFVSEQGESIIGQGYERFVSYVTVLGVFILIANVMGLVPGLESPTANVVVPLGLALCTFVY